MTSLPGVSLSSTTPSSSTGILGALGASSTQENTENHAFSLFSSFIQTLSGKGLPTASLKLFKGGVTGQTLPINLTTLENYASTTSAQANVSWTALSTALQAKGLSMVSLETVMPGLQTDLLEENMTALHSFLEEAGVLDGLKEDEQNALLDSLAGALMTLPPTAFAPTQKTDSQATLAESGPSLAGSSQGVTLADLLERAQALQEVEASNKNAQAAQLSSSSSAEEMGKAFLDAIAKLNMQAVASQKQKQSEQAAQTADAQRVSNANDATNASIDLHKQETKTASTIDTEVSTDQTSDTHKVGLQAGTKSDTALKQKTAVDTDQTSTAKNMAASAHHKEEQSAQNESVIAPSPPITQASLTSETHSSMATSVSADVVTLEQKKSDQPDGTEVTLKDRGTLTPPQSLDKTAENSATRFADLLAHSNRHGTHVPVSDQVAVNISHAFESGQDKITIKLHPAELGRIEVRMDTNSDGSVQMRFSVDQPATLDLLQRDQKGLERALSDAGIKTDGSTLNFNLRGEGQSSQQQAQSDGRSSSSQAGFGLDGENDDKQTLSASEVTWYINPDRLDVRV